MGWGSKRRARGAHLNGLFSLPRYNDIITFPLSRHDSIFAFCSLSAILHVSNFPSCYSVR
jgi:hypothetical protein